MMRRSSSRAPWMYRKARFSNILPVSFCFVDMEGRNSMVKTPLSNVPTQRRTRSKSYRLSRLSIAAVSHLGYTPGLTKLRQTTSRRASKSYNISEKVDPEQLALLVKREWQLSYATPLYAFRHTQLKAYSRQLSAFIAAEKQRGLAVEVGQESSFKVSFSVVPGVAETDDDAVTVLIQIHSKPPFARQDEPPKVVWSGWLTCVNGNQDYLRSVPKSFVCLPLFCSSGAEALTSLVKSWFRRTFDCSFGPLQINSTNLRWLAALWTDCHPKANMKQLKLVWTLPALPPLQVSYAVHPQDAWALWRSVREEGGGEEEGSGGMEEGGGAGRSEEEESSIGIEEVTSFMKGLEGHFYRHFKLDLSAGRLNEVSTAMGSAKHHGRVKISNSNYLVTTLRLLTECALLKMPI